MVAVPSLCPSHVTDNCVSLLLPLQLRDELVATESVCVELRDRQRELEAVVADRDSTVSSLGALLDAAVAQCAQLDANLIAGREREVALSEQLSSARAAAASAAAEYAATLEALQRQQTVAAANWLAERTAMSAAADAAIAAHNEYERNAEALRTRLSQQLDAATAELATSQIQAAATRSELRVVTAREADVAGQLRATQATVEIVSEELRVMTADRDETKAALADATQQCNELQRDLLETRRTVATLDGQLTTANRTIEWQGRVVGMVRDAYRFIEAGDSDAAAVTTAVTAPAPLAVESAAAPVTEASASSAAEPVEPVADVETSAEEPCDEVPVAVTAVGAEVPCEEEIIDVDTFAVSIGADIELVTETDGDAGDVNVHVERAGDDSDDEASSVMDEPTLTLGHASVAGADTASADGSDAVEEVDEVEVEVTGTAADVERLTQMLSASNVRVVAQPSVQSTAPSSTIAPDVLVMWVVGVSFVKHCCDSLLPNILQRVMWLDTRGAQIVLGYAFCLVLSAVVSAVVATSAACPVVRVARARSCVLHVRAVHVGAVAHCRWRLLP